MVTQVKLGALTQNWIFKNFFTQVYLWRLHPDFTIADEGLQTLGICSVPRAFEQGGIFIVSHLL
jgi:hypothetical protein